MRKTLFAALIFGTALAWNTAGSGQSASPANAPIGRRVCEHRLNDSVAKLEECIQLRSLWNDLSHFQEIANANPGPNGHGNRDTGTRGYAASVAYVAGLMRRAGYNVTIQRYVYQASAVIGTPQFRAAAGEYAFERDWFVARNSHAGTIAAHVASPGGSHSGCSQSEFAGFRRGNVALLARGPCSFDMQVANAQAGGASAVILYTPEEVPHEARLVEPAKIPVIGLASSAVGAGLLARYRAGLGPTVHIDIRTKRKRGFDYNVIADSPFGNPHRVVVIDAHLDSIYGAGMLDNASGSTTILDIALSLAKTPTRNQLRYIWFGGEELGLLGSHHYARHLTPAELRRIAFDVDVDVTATPNFDILVADPAFAPNVKRFPPNVVPESQIGNDYFADFFERSGVASRPANFGNEGTDSNSFSVVGVPNTGILTQQDCCKHEWERDLWGGFRGNYEGNIPSFDGGCVDYPHRWCDNLSNNDPFVLELASKAAAYVTFELANRRHLPYEY